MLQVLLAGGADISAQDNDGFTALMAAVGHGSTDLIDLLLAARPDLYEAHRILGTALHIAVFKNQAQTVSMLLQQGTDPNARNAAGERVLWNAFLSAERFGLVKTLLSHAADPNAADNRGSSVFWMRSRTVRWRPFNISSPAAQT
jgi:ankyrin repeat protein